jgi:hypothetical protein
MADIDISFGAVNVPSGASATLTVYEDTDQDGTAENQNSVSLVDGTTSYSVSGFAGGTGNDYWWDVDVSNTDKTVASIATAPVDFTIPDATGDVLNAPVATVNVDDVLPTFDPVLASANAPVASISSSTPAFTVEQTLSLVAPVSEVDVTTPALVATGSGVVSTNAPTATVASSSPTPTFSAPAFLNAPVASISSSTPAFTVDATTLLTAPTASVATSTPNATATGSGTTSFDAPVDDLVLDALVDTLIGSGVVSTNAPVDVLSSSTPPASVRDFNRLELVAQEVEASTPTNDASVTGTGVVNVNAPVSEVVVDALVDALTPSSSAPMSASVAEVAVSTPEVDVRTLRQMLAPTASLDTSTPTLEATPRGTVEVQANVENVDVTTPALVATGSSAVSFSAPPAVIQSASPFVTVELVDRLSVPTSFITSFAVEPTATGSGTATMTTSKDEGGTGAAEVEVLAPTPNRLVRILVAPLETVSYGLSGDEATASLSFGKPPESRRQPIFNKKDERETRASIGGNEEQVSSRSPDEPADIEVRIVDTVSPIPDGGTSDVTVEVRNTTASQKTETVELNVDSQDVTNPVDSTSVTVDSRSRKEITLTWDAFEGAAGTDGKTYDVTASTPNDSDTGQVEVLPTVSGVEYRPTILGTNSPLTSEAGEETAEVDVRFTNFGDSDGTSEPVFLDAWEQTGVDEVDLDLASGASKEITLTWDVPYYLDAGEYGITARGEPESDIPDQTVRDRVTDSTSVEVRRDEISIPEPEGTLEVTITGTNSPVNEGEPASVNVDVVNQGSEPESGTIVLANQSYGSGYGQDVGYANVDEVAPNGGVETIAVSWATQDGDKGDHDLTVRSGCANGVNDDENIDIANDACADETTVTVEETDGAISPFALNVTLDGVESPVNYYENAKVVANITHVGNVSMSGISKLTITGDSRSDVGVDVSGLNLGSAETVRKTFNWNASAGYPLPKDGEEDYTACVEAWRDGSADPPDDVACDTITVRALILDVEAGTTETGEGESYIEQVEDDMAPYDVLKFSWSFTAIEEPFSDTYSDGSAHIGLQTDDSTGFAGTVLFKRSFDGGGGGSGTETVDISGLSGPLYAFIDDGTGSFGSP